MTDLTKTLMILSNAFGPSGFEGEVREVFRSFLAQYAEITYDNLGGIMATRVGRSNTPKILLAAHLDEVGLLVRGILPNGYLKVVGLGSWWVPALLAQQVVVRSKKGDHFGVVGSKPPHYMNEDERNNQLKISDLYIDLGMKNAQEVSVMGIEIGNPVVPAVSARLMSPAGSLVGKAFDDRVGCAMIVQLLRELDQHPNVVIGAGTVQEENGIKGAKTIASVAQPDLCIVLEGAPADDFPDAGSIIQGRLGGGPQIRRYDPSMIANQALVDLAIQEAQKQGIHYQIAVREGGGTDGSVIQLQTNGGVPTIVIGVPVRYAHSHHGIIQIQDVESSIQLVKSLLQRLNAETVNNLKWNPWQ